MPYIGNPISIGNLTQETFNGNATIYTLSYSVGSNASIAVYISGVHQVPTTDYSVSGTTLTFTSTTPAGTANISVTFLSLPISLPVPGDGTVTDAKITAMATTKLTGTVSDAQIAGMDASKLTGTLPSAMATDTSNLESRLKTSELRIAGLNDSGINNSEGSFADAYTNETGVDTGASTNESYNATSNVYGNKSAAVTAYTNAGGQGDRTSTITVTTTATTGGGAIVNMVDGSTVVSAGSVHFPSGSAVTGKEIKFQFASAVVIDEAVWKRNNTGNLGTWKWQGSDDGSAWTDIGSSFTVGGSTSQTQTQLNGNTTAYIYYRLFGTSGSVSANQWDQEVEFKIDTPATANMTLVSNTVTAETEPTTIEVLLVNEPVDTVTLNTDLTMEVSIDGGATYDVVTLVDKGLFATGQNLLRGSADVTARTGTSIEYRLKTLNTKTQNQIGIVLAWS